jgi:glycosyltransferase involved in cell wall biosynthesis
VANARIPNLRVVIRGAAPDVACRRRLESQIVSMPRACVVDASFSPANDEEVELLFKAADIVALPYLEGSQSGVKFMAYAYGRPVLVSDVGSLAEYIVPGLTGECFRVQDEDSFNERLNHMLANLPDYQELAIQKHAYKHWSFDGMVAMVERACDQLQKEHRTMRLTPARGHSA